MSSLSSLDDLLRVACERGITHLTLYPVPSDDGKTTYWHARATPSTQHKYISVSDHDPVVALRGVLLGMPKAPKTRERVTATVKDPEPAVRTMELRHDDPPPTEDLETWLPKT